MAIEQNTDTGAVIAMQEECDQLREQVRILREVANQIVLEDEQSPGIIPADIVAGARAALEATKEGA